MPRHGPFLVMRAVSSRVSNFELPVSNVMSEAATAEDLLARVRKRDRQALGELYDRYAPRLRSIVLRMLAEHDAAEQALQDAFVHLWDGALLDVQKGASVAVWLTVLARAAALERLRAAHGTGTSPEFHPDGQQVSWLPGAEEIELLDRRRDLLKKIVNQLPKAQRDVLEMVVFEGWRETEIAGKLGEPRAKVKSELRAAMRFLRHRLRAVMGTWGANI